jgi:hypothetical protein
MRCAFSLFSVLVPVLVAARVDAQTTMPANAAWHTAPGGDAIGTLNRGADVSTVRTSNGWTMVTVEGWVASFRLGTRNDTLDRTVIGSGTAPIRAADGPTQPAFGEVVPGTLLKRLAERNGWTRVRRSAWVRSAVFAPPVASDANRGATTPPASVAMPPATGRGNATAVDPAMEKATRATSVRANPGGGDERATLRAGATVETLARSNGWARVRIEGWVAESDLVLADSSAGANLSAADLRTMPAAYRGRIVRWEVQVIALQRADPLRRGLQPDEQYLLARGPGDESAILYLVVPESLLDEARNIPTLASVSITARVRDGNSPPVGVPILEIISLSRSP